MPAVDGSDHNGAVRSQQAKEGLKDSIKSGANSALGSGHP